MTLTKDEYLEASAALATGFGPTHDFADPQIGATVQSEGGIPTAHEGLPGQLYTVDQLPNPAAAKAYGLPPVKVPEHLILEADDETNPQGPDTLDLISREHREHLGDPALDFTGATTTQDDALRTLQERTGEGLANKTAVDVEEGRKETTHQRRAREKAEAEAEVAQ